MIDTNEVRQRDPCNKNIFDLCNEVDRISDLHIEAHNALVIAENRMGQLKEEVKYLREVSKIQGKHVIALLNALVVFISHEES